MNVLWSKMASHSRCAWYRCWADAAQISSLRNVGERNPQTWQKSYGIQQSQQQTGGVGGKKHFTETTEEKKNICESFEQLPDNTIVCLLHACLS